MSFNNLLISAMVFNQEGHDDGDAEFIFGRKVDDAVFEKYGVEEEDIMRLIYENKDGNALSLAIFLTILIPRDRKR